MASVNAKINGQFVKIPNYTSADVDHIQYDGTRTFQDNTLGKKVKDIDATVVAHSQEIVNKFDKSSVVQTTGQSTTNVMSQKVVTDKINAKPNYPNTTSKSVSNDFITLKEKDVRNVSVDYTQQLVSIKGVNRIDIDSIACSKPATCTVTKENKGLKIITPSSGTNKTEFTRLRYVAEATGKLFLSCNAHSDGSAKDILVHMWYYQNSQFQANGVGNLYVSLDVTKGTEVWIDFYGAYESMGANTVYYENIQLSYSSLYDFHDYVVDINNDTSGEYSLPTISSSYETGGSGGRFFAQTAAGTLIGDFVPSNDYEKANVMIDGGLKIVSYNDLMSDPTLNAIAIRYNGRVCVSHNNEYRSGVATWLASNPQKILYPNGTYRNLSHIFEQGESILSSSDISVSYDYSSDKHKEKTIVCFGDSITGMITNDISYPSMIDLFSDMNCINSGFSGSSYVSNSDTNLAPFCFNELAEAVATGVFTTQEASAKVTPGSQYYSATFAEHLTTLKSVNFHKVDYVSIFYGTNDWGINAYLKSSDDPSTSSKQKTNVEDAMKYGIDKLLTAYPNLKIIIISPYFRSLNGADSNTTPNDNGDYLYDFADKIEEWGKNYFNATSINLYRCSGANKYSKYLFVYDGTHPTETMSRQIAKRIENACKLYD